MPFQGYCSECNEIVWLKDDGRCQNNHSCEKISKIAFVEGTQPAASVANSRVTKFHGYCAECQERVWLKANGACDRDHGCKMISQIGFTGEEPKAEPVPIGTTSSYSGAAKNQKKKHGSGTAVLSVLLILLLLGCCTLGNCTFNSPEKKMDDKVKKIDDKMGDKVKEVVAEYEGRPARLAKAVLEAAGYTVIVDTPGVDKDVVPEMDGGSDYWLLRDGETIRKERKDKLGLERIVKLTVEGAYERTERLAKEKTEKEAEKAAKAAEDAYQKRCEEVDKKVPRGNAWLLVERQGQAEYPYGFKLHSFLGIITETPTDDDTWLLIATCTVTNAFGAKWKGKCAAEVGANDKGELVIIQFAVVQ